MIRYYEIRPNREAWGTSLVVHAWLLALLLFVPAIRPPAEEPLTPPLELTLLDLGPAGDRVQGEDTRPAPKPAVLARVREVPVTRPIETLAEPKPAAVREARVPAAPPPAPAVQVPVEQQVQEPDAAALAAEEARRKAAEEARRREIEESGPTRTAFSGSGTSEQPPPPGGAVGTGRGATGNLSGRRVLVQTKPMYPERAEAVGAEGLVIAMIRVSPDGRVDDVVIKRSSGHPVLDQAAVDAMRAWKFSPLGKNERQVDQVGSAKIDFEIGKSPLIQ